MSQTTSPVAIVAGTPFQIQPPSSTPWGSVAVTNLSPYLFLVQLNAGAYWQAPWSEALYDEPPTNAPFSVVPSILIGSTVPTGAGAQVQSTWYGRDEKPHGSWPVSLAANALAASISGGSVTLSGQIPVINGTPTPLQVGGTVTAQPSLSSAPASGQTSVAAGPTATQLANLPCTRGLLLNARKANAASCYVGPSSVTTGNGLELPAGVAGLVVPVDNANRLWVMGTAGDGVTYMAL